MALIVADIPEVEFQRVSEGITVAEGMQGKRRVAAIIITHHIDATPLPFAFVGNHCVARGRTGRRSCRHISQAGAWPRTAWLSPVIVEIYCTGRAAIHPIKPPSGFSNHLFGYASMIQIESECLVSGEHGEGIHFFFEFRQMLLVHDPMLSQSVRASMSGVP